MGIISPDFTCPFTHDSLRNMKLRICSQELEEIYTDLCGTVSEAVLQGSEVVASRVS